MRRNNSSLEETADELHRMECGAAAENCTEPPGKRGHPSTISRELKRNLTKRGKYNPKTTHEMAMERRNALSAIPP